MQSYEKKYHSQDKKKVPLRCQISIQYLHAASYNRKTEKLYLIGKPHITTLYQGKNGRHWDFEELILKKKRNFVLLS